MNIEQIFNSAKEKAEARQSAFITTEDVLREILSELNELGIVDFNQPIKALDDCISARNEPKAEEAKLTPSLKKTFQLFKDLEQQMPFTGVKAIHIIARTAVGFGGDMCRGLVSPQYELALIKLYQEEMKSLKGNKETTQSGQYSEQEPQTALDTFGENLSLLTGGNPLINREDEIQRIWEVLLKKDTPHPILTGYPGVGKTAIVKELAKRIAAGNAPDAIKNVVKSIYSVSVTALLAGTRYRGDMEERLKAILDEVKESNNSIILFIDEIHQMMRAGANPDSAMDVANILKPYLTDGSIRVIGSTTIEEYRRFIEGDKALARRFMNVDIPEPSVEDTVKILTGIKSVYEDFHGVTYTPEAIRAAAELSYANMHDRYLPDKAIALIDEAGAVNAAMRYAADDSFDTVIGTERIEEVLFNTYKIPKSTIKTDEAEDVKNLADNLQKKVFGQDDAVAALIKRIKLAKAGIRDKEKPIANVLFVGPTGTGKTEITKVLAESLKMKLLRFDMSEYQEEHTVAKLFGSPAGYIGYEDGGLLTNAVRTDPNCVLLLDEIEKAHPKVYNALLQVMDYGFMTDSKGVKVDFRNTIIIMTSNCGATNIVKKGLGFGKASETVDTGAMDAALKDKFPPEFRGRLTDVIKFNDITPAIAEMIVRKEIDALSKTLADKNVKLSVTDECVRHLADIGYTPMTGARNIRNVVSNDISNLLVDDMLFGKLKNGGSVKVDWTNGAYKKTIRGKGVKS